MPKYSIQVNGSTHDVDVLEDMPLLWVLRDILGMKGTKFGCGRALCGACTVHLNDTAIRSCSIPVSAIGQSKITTIEGLSERVITPFSRHGKSISFRNAGIARQDGS